MRLESSTLIVFHWFGLLMSAVTAAGETVGSATGVIVGAAVAVGRAVAVAVVAAVGRGAVAVAGAGAVVPCGAEGAVVGAAATWAGVAVALLLPLPTLLPIVSRPMAR